MSTPWLFALASMEVFKGTGGNEADGMRYVSIMIAAVLIPLSFWWFFKLREPGFVKAAAHEKTPFWQDMKQTASNRNFIMLTLTIFTLAMGFNFVSLLGSYIPIFYVLGGDKVAGATLLGINGTIWAVTGLAAVFPLNWVSPKLGKRNTLVVAILLMCAAQLSKIVCYNPTYPYLIIIPTILLSAGMLFFFTLGSSMVGDICDEDDLKTGYRSEGSYYSVFWWFIKMGTALASFVTGVLIVFTMFDETQVTKVDALQGSIREFRSEVQSRKAGNPGVGNLEELLAKSRKRSAELMAHLDIKARETEKSKVHYQSIMQKIGVVNNRLANMSAASSLDLMDQELGAIEKEIVPLTQQSPYTLLMMRVVEIGLPLLLCLFSIFFVFRYSLTEKRCHEIKDLLRQRNQNLTTNQHSE
jgi:GPH family glycoside/pentoside/hexuronide:cation symporter